MRLAVLADIHANSIALDAILADVAEQKPDQVVIAGDIINAGPHSRQAVERLRALGAPLLHGNHERYALEYLNGGVPPGSAQEVFASALGYTVDQLGAECVEWLNALPTSIVIEDMLITHGSPRGDRDGIAPWRTDDELRAMFEGIDQKVLVGGHTHVPYMRMLDGHLLVNSGAVGLPLDGDPRAKYVLLTRRRSSWQVEHRYVAYDHQAAAGAFQSGGYLDVAGPPGRMFQREVETGQSHIFPYMVKLVEYARQHGISPLEASRQLELEE